MISCISQILFYFPVQQIIYESADQLIERKEKDGALNHVNLMTIISNIFQTWYVMDAHVLSDTVVFMFNRYDEIRDVSSTI